MGYVDYHTYIRSPKWKVLSQRLKRAAGFRCRLCNETGELHTHHRTYERLGHERDEDLIVLCADCHAKFHDKLPEPPATPADPGWQLGRPPDDLSALVISDRLSHGDVYDLETLDMWVVERLVRMLPSHLKYCTDTGHWVLYDGYEIEEMMKDKGCTL